jgi:hypothetical protein
MKAKCSCLGPCVVWCQQPPAAHPRSARNPQVDIWAAGILAYELLVGKPPFEVDDEQETRRRIIHETALALPSHVSAGAANFIRTALAKDAVARPSAADLLRHPWVAPHLVAALSASSGAAGVSAAAALEGGRAAALAALRTRPQVFAGAGEGRSASFNCGKAAGAVAGGGAGHKLAGLTIALADELNGSLSFSAAGPGSSASASAACSRAAFAAGRGSGPLGSPSAGSPSTPQPYLGGRKPTWDADRLPAGAFTTVRTTGLPDAQSGPAAGGSTTAAQPEPAARSKLSSAGPGALPAAAPAAAAGVGSHSNPLLKAALSSSMNKGAVAAAAAAAAGRLGVAAGHGGMSGAIGGGSSGSPRAATNVKMRIKEYFVARSNNEASVGAGTLT